MPRFLRPVVKVSCSNMLSPNAFATVDWGLYTNASFPDAFGLVAFVAMTPLVTIQLLGLLSKIKATIVSRAIEPVAMQADLSDEIVDFDFYNEEDDI